jgi:phospholipase C
MKSPDLLRYLLLVAATSLFLKGCAQGQSSPTPFVTSVVPAGAHSQSSSVSPIQHVVLVIQENRTFNDFFATYPGADGTTKAEVLKVDVPGCHVFHGVIHLLENNLAASPDMNHDYQAFHIALGGGLQGFDKIKFQGGKPECKTPYQYVNPAQIQPYWSMAKQYTLAEHMFSTQGSNSFTAHQDLIRGGTNINSEYAIVNDPTQYPWGCDAPPGTKTSLVDVNDVVYPGQGPYPCTTDFPGYTSDSYKTLRDLLDAKNVTWKYYVPPSDIVFGKLMSAFDVIASVRFGSEWNTNVIRPETQIFNDIRTNSLANMSWVVPDKMDSDHPGTDPDDGPEWVASVVNAIGESPYWDSTAIVIVWDDWGGLYDNRVGTQQYGFGSLGLRVPAIIVSPYALAGHISQTDYEFGSIIRYIEENWQLGYLGTSDVRAKSIIDCFNYYQEPITFVPIGSKLDKEYFIHRKPSYLPVDDDM